MRNRLAERRQLRPDNERSLHIIEANDREVAWDRNSPLVSNVNDTRRHVVVAGEDRGRSRLELNQALRGGNPGFEIVIALDRRTFGRVDTCGLQRIMEPQFAFRRGLVRWISANKADAPVAQFDQVASDVCRRPAMIDPDR